MTTTIRRARDRILAAIGIAVAGAGFTAAALVTAPGSAAVSFRAHDGHVQTTALRIHPPHPGKPSQPVLPVSKGGTIPPGEDNANFDLHRPV
jgi:hypothetical protein